MIRWLRNAEGKPRWLAMLTWIYLLWSLLPVLLAVQFSFNKGKSRSSWQGFSLRWYTGDPNLSVLHDPSLRTALRNSLALAGFTMLIATPIGVALAIGLARWRSRAAKPANALMLFPLITPEIVMGVSLFLVFVHLFTFVPRGFPTQLLGHVTFTISYVVVIVRGRLLAIGREYEEAGARSRGHSLAGDTPRTPAAPLPRHLRQPHGGVRDIDRRLRDLVVSVHRCEHGDGAHQDLLERGGVPPLRAQRPRLDHAGVHPARYRAGRSRDEESARYRCRGPARRCLHRAGVSSN